MFLSEPYYNFLFTKTNRRTKFPNLFLSRNSTYFGQSFCLSSGFLHCTLGTGICHTVLMRAFKRVQDGTMHVHMNIKFVNAKKAKETYQYRNSRRKMYKTKAAIWYNKTCREKQLTPNYISISSILNVLKSCHQTCMTYTSAECTVENSWWWAEKLFETCRVSWQK